MQDLRKLNLSVVFWVPQSLHMCVCRIDEKLSRVPLQSLHMFQCHVDQNHLEFKTYIQVPIINWIITYFYFRKTDHRNINKIVVLLVADPF